MEASYQGIARLTSMGGQFKLQCSILIAFQDHLSELEPQALIGHYMNGYCVTLALRSCSISNDVVSLEILKPQSSVYVSMSSIFQGSIREWLGSNVA